MVFFQILVAVCAVLAVWSWRKIKGSKQAGFIYGWGFLLGAFVWEDLLIFSIYGMVANLAVIWLGHWKYGLLFLLAFWLVRSFGEAAYFFLEQFIVPTHYPHFIDRHFKLIRKLFGEISYQQCLIMMQVIFQVVAVISLVGLIVLLLSWNQI